MLQALRLLPSALRALPIGRCTALLGTMEVAPPLPNLLSDEHRIDGHSSYRGSGYSAYSGHEGGWRLCETPVAIAVLLSFRPPLPFGKLCLYFSPRVSYTSINSQDVLGAQATSRITLQT